MFLTDSQKYVMSFCVVLDTLKCDPSLFFYVTEVNPEILKWCLRRQWRRSPLCVRLLSSP